MSSDKINTHNFYFNYFIMYNFSILFKICWHL